MATRASEDLIRLFSEQIEIQNQRMSAQLEAQKQQTEAQNQQIEAQRQHMEIQMKAQNQQMEVQRLHMEAQMKAQSQQMEAQKLHMEAIVSALSMNKSPSVHVSTKFCEFDPVIELFDDYWRRFITFSKANLIPPERIPEIFLTNQSASTYRMLINMASQKIPKKDVNNLTVEEIYEFMMDQFNGKKFIVRERYKFWTNTKRRPGETVHDLAARIREEAATCDFASILDPLDEALRTRFVCSINDEATIKALFKIRDENLSFSKAIEVAAEMEEVAKVAKETVDIESSEIFKVSTNHKNQQELSTPHRSYDKCFRCDKSTHQPSECPFLKAICYFCNKEGHIKIACRKRKQQLPVKRISLVRDSRPLVVSIYLKNSCRQPPSETPVWSKTRVERTGSHSKVIFEVDTGSKDSFISENTWKMMGRPKISPSKCQYLSASDDELPIMGNINVLASMNEVGEQKKLSLVVTKMPLNLLGRQAIKEIGLSVDSLLQGKKSTFSPVHKITDTSLQKACLQLCSTEFKELFREELGTLKDFELEVKFKPESVPVYRKPRPIPIALQEDVDQALQTGINKGVWEQTQFNTYGTPVVPIKKKSTNGQKPKLRICGDYSVTVNQQLEQHRHPMPLPEDLMRKLGHGYRFSKIDLADAYNQILLGPDSQKKLALSTHRGVFLQKRLPFGITSAPGYFQEIMDKITNDLPGVAVYLDDILVSGDTAEQHLSNLRGLLTRLQEKGLRCRLEKCEFAQNCVEYLGHYLSEDGIKKGPKADAILKMPPPSNLAELRSFLGQVQFYSKFLVNISTTLEPLYRLTKKGVSWTWGPREQKAFSETKENLASDTILAHFDPSLDVGISCDASNVGIGAVLFHRYPDGSERPIINASKTLSSCQRNYSQIQKEALAIIFALNKFHQYLYGRKFILVTDHKPLIALFGPAKPIPALAANRLARWALTLSQYDYTIEYRKTSQHGNADALSRLPIGPDRSFDRSESGADTSTVCTINMIYPSEPEAVARETKSDPVLNAVTKKVKNGWPEKLTSKDSALKPFFNIKDSLYVSNGCVFYGDRLVIPKKLQSQILDVLHLGHFGMQRMKQLARTAVYWQGIDMDICLLARRCTACNEHQNLPAKEPIHPWVVPDKPWERLHIDHAINFKGHNWLIIVDAYSKYPCIYQMSTTTSQSTMRKLEETFAHFGYPRTLVSDNAQCFSSHEFQSYCQERGIHHIQGAPYFPQTNGTAERMVQTFKKSLKKSSLNPTDALQEFLIQYRRTPLHDTGSSPSQLLNGRQIRSRIDIIQPTPSNMTSLDKSSKSRRRNRFIEGSPCYTLSFKDGKRGVWVPGVVVKSTGHLLFNVKLTGNVLVKRHIDQMRVRYA